MTTPRLKRTELRDATATNQTTGEIIELGNLSGMVPSGRARKRKELKFAMVNLETVTQLEMSKGVWKLFWQVVAHMDRESGQSRVTTAELALLLGWSGPVTSRALSSLATRGILIRHRMGVWRINPLLLTRNSAVQWEEEMVGAPAIDWTE